MHVLQGSSPEGLIAWPIDRVWDHLAVGDPIGRSDRFGYALGAADVNGDGKAELAIAAPVDGGLAVSASGQQSESDGKKSVVHVLYGTGHPYGPGWEQWQSWYEATDTLEEGN